MTMQPAAPRAFPTLEDFLRFSADRGITYFQIFDGVPDPRLFERLLPLREFEQFVEIEARGSKAFIEAVAPMQGLPAVGAFTCGAFMEFASSPADVQRLVDDARRFYVPYQQ